MKVALICDGPVPHARMNYRGEIFLRLLPGDGHTVHLVALGVEGASALRPFIVLRAHSCGQYKAIAGIQSIPLRIWQVFRLYIATKQVLRGDIDLIRSIAFLPTIVAVLARGRRKIPILANMSDFYSDLYSGGRLPMRRLALWLIRHLERLSVRIDYLIVDTPAQRERWVTRGIEPSRCVVIPHGLPRSWTNRHRTVAPPVQMVSDHILFYVGDISVMDGVDVLIRSLHQLRHRDVPVRLLIVGKGTNAYTDELHDLIKHLGLDSWVEHIESVPNTELPSIIDRVSICVAPFRLQETSATSIPNKVLEYLTSSKPIIVPAGSALEDAFGPALCYFKPDDPSSLADAVETLLAGRPQALALRKATQRALQWPSLMNHEWALIESIMAHQVGDARRFDYHLRDQLTDSVAG